MTSVIAGATWKGSGLSAAGRSAWRSAASAIAPWAVRAARARFIDSASSVSRWLESNARNAFALALASGAAVAGGLASGRGAAFGLALAAAVLAAFAAGLGRAALVFAPVSAIANSVLSSGPVVTRLFLTGVIAYEALARRIETPEPKCTSNPPSKRFGRC